MELPSAAGGGVDAAGPRRSLLGDALVREVLAQVRLRAPVRKPRVPSVLRRAARVHREGGAVRPAWIVVPMVPAAGESVCGLTTDAPRRPARTEGDGRRGWPTGKLREGSRAHTALGLACGRGVGSVGAPPGAGEQGASWRMGRAPSPGSSSGGGGLGSLPGQGEAGTQACTSPLCGVAATACSPARGLWGSFPEMSCGN